MLFDQILRINLAISKNWKPRLRWQNWLSIDLWRMDFNHLLELFQVMVVICGLKFRLSNWHLYKWLRNENQKLNNSISKLNLFYLTIWLKRNYWFHSRCDLNHEIEWDNSGQCQSDGKSTKLFVDIDWQTRRNSSWLYFLRTSPIFDAR